MSAFTAEAQRRRGDIRVSGTLRGLWLGIFLLGTIHAVAQTSRDFRRESILLKRTLDVNHIQPPDLDDSFSKYLLEAMINQLDPGHLYFNMPEIETLYQFNSSLDEEWKGSGWEFLPKVTTLYREALRRGSALLGEEIGKPVVWETAEHFVPKGKGLPWSAAEMEQRDRWRLWIKYKILSNLSEKPGFDSATAKGGMAFIRSRESDLKKRILTIESRRVKRILDSPAGFENTVGAIYFRLVAAYYDPHSLYLSPGEYEKFKAALSTKAYAFGFGLGENQNGNIIIEHLIPGGPAWKSGVLHKGDMLLELRWQGKPAFDLTGIGLEEFDQLLDRADPMAAEFTIQQTNGVKSSVVLKKEKINSEENTVRGFVLKGERKIGYISLPGFYSEWDNGDKSSCANDVASEVIKLKGENIDGLILDIRSNGGGSLGEAIEMAGIFIDDGAMAMIGEKNAKVTTLKDFNRGTVYDGPLLILINGQSASASEILSAAIQDYHRGILVGSPTYGKATGQQVFALDSVASKKSNGQTVPANAMGYVTVTRMHIYRVTGKSNQGVGVAPDIPLPDMTDLPAFHEMANHRAFHRDSVNKKSYYKALPSIPLHDLQEESMARIAKEGAFIGQEAKRARLAIMMRDTVEIILSWKDFSAGMLPKTSLLTPVSQATKLFSVSPPEFNMARMDLDPFLKDYTEVWEKFLSGDPWVEEAFRVALDYIHLRTGK